MRTSTWTILLVAPSIIAGAMALSGCGSPHRAEPFTGMEPLLDTPQKERGALVFARNCNQCHPGGEGGLGPALNSKPLPGPAIKLVVRTGPAQMPSFPESEISDEELDAVADYVMALRDTVSDREKTARAER
jgi:mono/diheme cytochrome c family protein